MDAPEAARVVLSYPEGLSDWGRDQVETDRYRSYFARVMDEVAVGDVREEFVDVGCCGDSLDVPFRVERIEAGGGGDDADETRGDGLDGTRGDTVDTAVVTSETTVDYETRDGDVDGGWRVQSAAGPSGSNTEAG
ncbi:hypothetical protein [Halorubrum depositum]|uniref:hypothetical protein n=1 Tax=Halorubrum depositum TaxID=2583992 RepID=UPI0011A84555|nr:hypothetical protein [Halorubrum depositum]